MKLLKGEILSNARIGEGLYKMTVFSPYISANSLPGQFVNIKCCRENTIDPILRRPFSIHDVESAFKSFSILYILKGRGTHYLSGLKTGDIVDFMGPLGNGINNEEIKSDNCFLAGGGIGVAPLYFLAKNLSLAGKNVFFLAGFKDNNFILFEKMLSGLKIIYEIYSENGLHGKKGMAVDFIRQNLNDYKKYEFICCGPKLMLKSIKNILDPEKIKSKAIFEEIMACGIGVCKGCAIKVKKENGDIEYKTVCRDGPVFNLSEVEID